MDMAGRVYERKLAELVEDGDLSIEIVDTAVANILRAKFRLGLFENPYANPEALPASGSPEALATAKSAALQSVVMLKNDGSVLPLSTENLDRVAVIGALAEAP